MTLYTPKNVPWLATTGYEMVDAFPVPINPIISERLDPCYIPNGMVTKPLKFPNLSTGFNRCPLHVARAALSMRYPDKKSLDHLKSLREEVSSSLEDAQAIEQKLDHLISEEKKKLEPRRDELAKWTQETAATCMTCKVDELISEQEKVMRKNNQLQDCKRKLQACIQGIEAPLQICQECLCHREFREKHDFVNDEVEQLLMKESELFRQSIADLEKCLEQCDTQILQGKKMQIDWEKFIKAMNWIVRVEKLEIKIKKYFDSESWKEESQDLIKQSNIIVHGSKELLKQIENDIDKTVKNISKTWDKTNHAFIKKCDETKGELRELKNSLEKIKNEVFNVEKSLKYLKSNKELKNELQQGKDVYESLLRTQKNLESAIKSKVNSLFTDKQKCMSMRNSYPLSIITQL